MAQVSQQTCALSVSAICIRSLCRGAASEALPSGRFRHCNAGGAETSAPKASPPRHHRRYVFGRSQKQKSLDGLIALRLAKAKRMAYVVRMPPRERRP